MSGRCSRKSQHSQHNQWTDCDVSSQVRTLLIFPETPGSSPKRGSTLSNTVARCKSYFSQCAIQDWNSFFGDFNLWLWRWMDSGARWTRRSRINSGQVPPHRHRTSCFIRSRSEIRSGRSRGGRFLHNKGSRSNQWVWSWTSFSWAWWTWLWGPWSPCMLNSFHSGLACGDRTTSTRIVKTLFKYCQWCGIVIKLVPRWTSVLRKHVCPVSWITTKVAC